MAFRLSGFISDLYDSIFLVLKYAVCLFHFTKLEPVSDQWRRINLPLSDERKDLIAVASVNTAGLEDKILAVHVWQRKRLRSII